MNPATEVLMKRIADLGENHSYGVESTDSGFKAWVNFKKEADMGGNWTALGNTELTAALSLKHQIQDWLERPNLCSR